MKNMKKFAGVLAISSLLFLSVPVAFASVPADSKAMQAASEVIDATIPIMDETLDTTHAGKHVVDPFSQAKLKDFGWRIVNFIALMIILVHFAAKPLGKSLSSRREEIVNEIDDLEKRKQVAEQSYNNFQQKIAVVEADIDKIVERAVAQAEVEKRNIIARAESAAEEMMRSAEQAVANEVAEARTMLREEVAEKAVTMAEGLLRKNLRASDQKAIIENYLNKVEAIS
ncbi:F0F1 ATP synthase subunit B [Desulforhopalus vacuolatus]|uniref:F0F1 ATP synthase subunit B n=1 Tax=Desulforhopalus vacuolatus TaxID=40414 RepID=UPI001965964D|nr:F0F1 ATP synthase subunit B [Desulforhopalus vacuolatus]MBM9519324.1 F0F1 ATP synthase subunit B [Desulforhopalus vacuolatus]